ncbi:unnamed protein product [Pleuronectes platessa]|uniref:Uncharacterized protein n=1 Tax=Pleuronectes platessa TaxID=8262 RepID=A0A9N7TXM5_PLEPL|nr:unnamed protein product [Pleuronectes platessa]
MLVSQPAPLCPLRHPADPSTRLPAPSPASLHGASVLAAVPPSPPSLPPAPTQAEGLSLPYIAASAAGWRREEPPGPQTVSGLETPLPGAVGPVDLCGSCTVELSLLHVYCGWRRRRIQGRIRSQRGLRAPGPPGNVEMKRANILVLATLPGPYQISAGPESSGATCSMGAMGESRGDSQRRHVAHSAGTAAHLCKMNIHSDLHRRLEMFWRSSRGAEPDPLLSAHSIHPSLHQSHQYDSPQPQERLPPHHQSYSLPTTSTTPFPPPVTLPPQHQSDCLPTTQSDSRSARVIHSTTIDPPHHQSTPSQHKYESLPTTVRLPPQHQSDSLPTTSTTPPTDEYDSSPPPVRLSKHQSTSLPHQSPLPTTQYDSLPHHQSTAYPHQSDSSPHRYDSSPAPVRLPLHHQYDSLPTTSPTSSPPPVRLPPHHQYDSLPTTSPTAYPPPV